MYCQYYRVSVNDMVYKNFLDKYALTTLKPASVPVHLCSYIQSQLQNKTKKVFNMFSTEELQWPAQNP